ncbi:Uncharacterised protein [Bordetella pertussis]|nr:Uncharacterised protein [Bordetella pertussis]CPI71509.1 Uncharacterised protein [Bordetella pertussis]CPO23575.1 Uncharacterised protein [Bordetella pertussis]CPP90596.1 Uncharacterised protein [Bordetella pertussis]CRE15953.1 Uncharacterised protein [Bordetella pertussis]
MPQPSSWASLASERPICSVSWRSSRVSREAWNHWFQPCAAASSPARQASNSRHHSGASARAITVTSWLSIHARVLASSCTNPSSMAASRPYE